MFTSSKCRGLKKMCNSSVCSNVMKTIKHCRAAPVVPYNHCHMTPLFTAQYQYSEEVRIPHLQSEYAQNNSKEEKTSR